MNSLIHIQIYYTSVLYILSILSVKIYQFCSYYQITKLEARVSRQHTIRKEMQILFEEEKASLMEQHKRDERALSDMDDRLQLIRRREQELKDEFNEVIIVNVPDEAWSHIGKFLIYCDVVIKLTY